MTNPFLTALWLIAAAGLLIGFIASVADFGYDANVALQAAVANTTLSIGGLALIGGLVAAAVTWKPAAND